jgi:hypothetical protein
MRVPRIGVGTLVLLITIVALTLALVIQNLRSSHREEALRAEEEALRGEIENLLSKYKNDFANYEAKYQELKEDFEAYKKAHP